MPENPNLNSVRMQRAQRINSIEDALLSTRIYLMDKERRHQMRVANQDIRMVNLTLDYISSSSGDSPEALPPTYVEHYVEKESEPCFMYGERLRRWKSRRIQSAPSMSRRMLTTEKKDTAEDASNGKPLANSKKKSWGSVYFPMEQIREHKDDAGRPGILRVKARIRPSTSFVPKEAFVTSQNPNLSHAGSERGMSEEDIELLQKDIERSLAASRQALEAVKQEHKQLARESKSTLTHAVNKVRVMTSSTKRSVTPMQALMKPLTKTPQQKNAWEEKMTLNVNRKQKLEARLKIFMTSHPVGRTHESPH